MDTISLEGGTTADELTDEVIGLLDKSFIRLENVVSISTDGCKVMLGEENRVHAILNTKMTHLPEFGGCPAHDCSNVLKSAVDKLHPDLLKIYHSLPSYISSQSLHRWRNYQDFCSEVGIDPRNPPKMFEVRFRVLPKMAQWMDRYN